jgi:hypothetical protein
LRIELHGFFILGVSGLMIQIIGLKS